MSEPTSVPADGTLRVQWVPAIADTTAPTVTELGAAGSVDLSCYLTADGFTPGTDEASIADDRLCSRATFERPGRTSDTLEIGYVYQPQDAAAQDNEAWTTLRPRTSGYVVVRWGVDYETAFAIGDTVDVMPVQCGEQRKMTPEANTVLRVMQKLFVTGSVRKDVDIAA